MARTLGFFINFSSRGDGEIKQFKDDYAIREFTGEGENAHE